MVNGYGPWRARFLLGQSYGKSEFQTGDIFHALPPAIANRGIAH
jgi:hypothetical protein